MAVAWLLPTLDTIPNSALGATDNLKFRSLSDMYSTVARDLSPKESVFR